jgi:ribulose-phosphate 3-epimerase
MMNSLKRKKLIAPSILAADFANLQKEIEAAKAGGADWIHVDVMDGHFVPNLTIGVPVVESLKRFSPLPLDVHLMIENPEKYAEQFIRAGADYLTIHVESVASDKLAALLKDIRRWGAKAGITLRPGTDLATVTPFLPLVDLLLIMTVEPGFGGQKFIMSQLSKISLARKIIDENKYKILLEVDGGINKDTVVHCQEVDVLVAGNAIFRATDYSQAISDLKMGQS